MATILNNN